MRTQMIYQEEKKRVFGKDISNLNGINNNNNNNIIQEEGKKLRMSRRTMSMNQQQQNQNDIQIMSQKNMNKGSQERKEVYEIMEIEEISYDQRMDKYKEEVQKLKKTVEYENIVGFYLSEITEYLIFQQEDYQVENEYMKRQDDINEKMRRILIDWLVDVQVKFKLQNETLHVCVNLIDRYLSMEKVERQSLQLVGVSCMFIASKHVEIYAPELKDFVYVTDNAYSKQQILDMEGKILNQLQFRLNLPSVLIFYHRLQLLWDDQNHNKHPNKMDCLARYILDLSLLDLKFAKYSPLLLASATIYLVNKLFKITNTWTSNFLNLTHFTESAIRPCAKELCIMLQNLDPLSPQSAVRRKYQDSKYLSISNIKIERTN